MSLTSIKYDYNVAKVIDTPWNTIINGLNYTKTNLTPLGLRYTYANNYDNGMLLKEFSGNSLISSVPIEDFSYSNAVRDYSDINKYWIINSAHLTKNDTGPAIYCAVKNVDNNGFEFSSISDACPELTRFISNGYFIYQDNSIMCMCLNKKDTGTSNNVYLYRFLKKENRLEVLNSQTYTNGIIKVLKIENGYIYYLAQYGSSSYLYRNIYRMEISSGLITTVKSLESSEQGVLTVYPSNLYDNTYFILNNMPLSKWYKIQLGSNDTSTVVTELNIDIDTSSYTSNSSSANSRIKRFCNVYKNEGQYYLAVITINSYSYTTSQLTSNIQVYTMSETELKLKQTIELNGFSCIPKNNWSTIFIGTASGLRVFNWDNLEGQFVEKPSIYSTIQQFGFDIDERLWILDGDSNIFRYTYNQPLTVDYKFEKQKYMLTPDPVETWVDVRVLNYMGEYISSKLILKAFGNFTFNNNKKEIEITLSSNEYTRLPIYLIGSGKYEIRL